MMRDALSCLTPIQGARWTRLSKGVKGLCPSVQRRPEPVGVTDWMEGEAESLCQVRKYEYRHASH